MIASSGEEKTVSSVPVAVIAVTVTAFPLAPVLVVVVIVPVFVPMMPTAFTVVVDWRGAIVDRPRRRDIDWRRHVDRRRRSGEPNPREVDADAHAHVGGECGRRDECSDSHDESGSIEAHGESPGRNKKTTLRSRFRLRWV
jgi:hypothetical protein